MDWAEYEAFDLLDDERKLGVVRIELGVLHIVSLQDESQREKVQKSLDEFNNRPFLVERAPKAKGKGSGAVEYERGSPQFEDVLIRKLRSERQIKLLKK